MDVLLIPPVSRVKGNKNVLMEESSKFMGPVRGMRENPLLPVSLKRNERYFGLIQGRSSWPAPDLN